MDTKEKTKFIKWYCRKYHILVSRAEELGNLFYEMINSPEVSRDEIYHGNISELVDKYGNSLKKELSYDDKYLLRSAVSKYRVFCGLWEENPVTNDDFFHWCYEEKRLSEELARKISCAIRYLSDIGIDLLSGDERNIADEYLKITSGKDTCVRQSSILYRRAIRKYREYVSSC